MALKRTARVQERPRNAESTRNAIIEAARFAFARDGYDAIGIREIAARAGVSSSLVSRYFGGKEALFRAVLRRYADVRDVFEGDPDTLANRLAEAMLEEAIDRSYVDAVMIMLRAASSPQTVKILRQVAEEQIYRPIAARLGDPENLVKAKLIGVLMLGVAAERSVSSDFQLSADDRKRLKIQVSALIRAIITESSPGKDALPPRG